MMTGRLTPQERYAANAAMRAAFAEWVEARLDHVYLADALNAAAAKALRAVKESTADRA